MERKEINAPPSSLRICISPHTSSSSMGVPGTKEENQPLKLTVSCDIALRENKSHGFYFKRGKMTRKKCDSLLLLDRCRSSRQSVRGSRIGHFSGAVCVPGERKVGIKEDLMAKKHTSNRAQVYEQTTVRTTIQKASIRHKTRVFDVVMRHTNHVNTLVLSLHFLHSFEFHENIRCTEVE